MRSKRFLIGTAAVAVLVATALPASAGCETSVTACGLDHDDTRATSMHVKQISTTVPLRTDNEGLSFQVYVSLIPAQYDIPTTPAVAVSLAEVEVPTGNGGQGESWIESTLAIRVANMGVDGWYPISRASTETPEYDSGRMVGWPTYLADGSLTTDDAGWVGDIHVGDVQALSMAFESDGSDPSDELVDWTEQRDPFLSLTPVFSGPTRYRVQNSAKPPAPVFDPIGGAPAGAGFPNVTDLAPLDTGQVHLVLNPDINDLDAESSEPLPDLPFSEGRTLGEVIELDQTLPGAFWETDQIRFTQTDDLDDGHDGQVPSAGPVPAAKGAVVAPPNAQLVGFIPPVIVLPRGSSLDFTNGDTGTHDVTAVDYDPVTYKAVFHANFAAPGETKPVEGVADLAPGQYDFVCSIHRGQMTGTLVIF